MNGIERNRAFDEETETNPKEVSEEAAAQFVGMIKRIVDDTISARLAKGDIGRFYTALVVDAGTISEDTITEATQKTITEKQPEYIVSTMGTKKVIETAYSQHTESIKVKYNDSYYYAQNRSRMLLKDGDSVVVYTTDDINRYILHKI